MTSSIYHKVWHEVLLSKLKENEVNGTVLDLNKTFFHKRHQRVVFNDQPPNYKFLKAGVSQESVLIPLLFLIYINKIAQDLLCMDNIFAEVIFFYF